MELHCTHKTKQKDKEVVCGKLATIIVDGKILCKAHSHEIPKNKKHDKQTK